MTTEFQPVRKIDGTIIKRSTGNQGTRRWMLCSIALLSGATLAAEVVRSEYQQHQPTGTHSVIDQLFTSPPSKNAKKNYSKRLLYLLEKADYTFSDALVLPKVKGENGVIVVICAPERRIFSPEDFDRLVLAPNDVGPIPLKYRPRMLVRPELGALVIKEVRSPDPINPNRIRQAKEMVYVSFRDGRNIWLKDGVTLEFAGGNERDIYTGLAQLVRYDGKFNTRSNRISIAAHRSILYTPEPYARMIDEAFPGFRPTKTLR